MKTNFNATLLQSNYSIRHPSQLPEKLVSEVKVKPANLDNGTLVGRKVKGYGDFEIKMSPGDHYSTFLAINENGEPDPTYTDMNTYYLGDEKIDKNKQNSYVVDYMDQLYNVVNDYKKSAENSLLSNLNFGGGLGDKYKELKVKLEEQYEGGELKKQLENLDLSFDIITETTVIKPMEKRMTSSFMLQRGAESIEEEHQKYLKFVAAADKARELNPNLTFKYVGSTSSGNELSEDDKSAVDIVKNSMRELLQSSKQRYDLFSKSNSGSLYSVFDMMTNGYSGYSDEVTDLLITELGRYERIKIDMWA